jgi:hypothetical protein
MYTQYFFQAQQEQTTAALYLNSHSLEAAVAVAVILNLVE